MTIYNEQSKLYLEKDEYGILKSKISDKHCKILTELSYQKCIYEKDKNNIVKVCASKKVVDWETIVYLYLVDYKITPLISISNMTIEYHIDNKITLYEYIKQNKQHLKLILNELVSFVSKFRHYSFLHGNLHIHNILVDTKKFPGLFYVIDLGNSFLHVSKLEPSYKRSSFLGEMYNKNESVLFEYWDFFTLYISLKPLLDSHYFFYFENLIKYYIKTDVLDNFNKEYEKHTKNILKILGKE